MKKGRPELQAFLSLLPGGREREALAILSRHPELAEDPASLVNGSLHGRRGIVERLLQYGADPDAIVPSHERYRPLHRAIEHRGVPKNDGHLETVNLLLEAGADPEARSTWMGLTALATAGMAGDPEMIEPVLRRRPTMSLNLFHAALLADARRVKAILGKDPKAAGRADINGMTPLHYAALSGLNKAGDQKLLSAVTLALCEAGADPDSCPKIGPYPKTPVLHFAAWGRNRAVAEVLLERGANPNLGFPNCLWREPGDLGDLFVKHGADVNGREPSGQPLLHSRVHWNLTSVVLWLLKNGADPNLRDLRGNTALHEAAARGASPRIVEALLAHGAKKTLRNKAGETPNDVSLRRQRKEFPPRVLPERFKKLTGHLKARRSWPSQ